MSITTAPSDNSEANASNAQSQSQSPPAPQTQSQPAKRSSRRANTAERRATHNAVERARRETLNSRFLDLAALLPNLAAVRRPSKSAIVNSSISIIQSQRRNRVIAARELRLAKAESDALRQELNQWRQRAGNLPPVEEPPRSADYISLLNVDEELEMQENPRAFEMHEGDDDYGEEDEEQLSPESAHPYGHGAHMSISGIPSQKVSVTHHQQQQQLQQAQQAQQAQAQQAHLAQQQQQQQQQAAAFAQQKAALARVSQQAQQQIAIPRMQPAHQQQQQQHLYSDNFFTSNDVYSFPIDNANMFGAQTWSQKAIQVASNGLVTPPGSAHGHGHVHGNVHGHLTKTSPYATTANQAFLANYGQQAQAQAQASMFQPGLGLFGTEDDNSSVGSSGHDFSTGSGSPSMNVNGSILGTSPVDHPFSFAVGSSPPHSQPQSRRPSVNIPAHAYLANASAGQSPVPKTNGSPVQMHVGGPQFTAMGLMM